MAEITIYLNGRSYDISCDNGQEGRIAELASYIDQRMHQISRAGGAYNEAHLLTLAALVLADELFDARENGGVSAKPARAAAAPAVNEDTAAVAKVLEQLTKRIEGVAAKIAQAS